MPSANTPSGSNDTDRQTRNTSHRRTQIRASPRASVYTGRTDQPCCLCENPETSHRIAVPPRAIQLMDNGEPIAWRDVTGPVTLEFCDDDWETVAELVLELGMQPLERCNAARADFDLRADFEALLNDTRSEPDQTALEQRLLDSAADTLAAADDPHTERRDLVEARLVQLAAVELDLLATDPRRG